MKKSVVLITLSLIATSGQSQTRFLDSLLQIVAKHPRDTNEIRALDWIASEYMRTDIEKAKSYTYKEIALAKELGTIFGLPAAYSGLMRMHQDEGRMDSAQYYLGLLKKLSDENPTNKKAGVNYYNSAGLFYKEQGKYKEALPNLLEAVRFIDPKKDKTNLAGAFLNIGNLYSFLGELRKAADYHLKSLTLFEEVNHKRGQAFILQSLGDDFIALKQYPVAEKYLFQAVRLKEESGDRRGVISSWMSLGELYQQMDKVSLSMKYSTKALTRARELKLRIEEMRILFNRGILLKALKKNDDARKAFLETMAFARQAGDSLLVSKTKAELIMIQNNTGKDRSEEETLNENIRISLEKGDRFNTAEGYFKIAEWYASHEEYEKAFGHLKQGQLLRDSVRGNEIIIDFKKLEEAYKSEKREKQIALLEKDKELQQQELQRRSQLMIGSVMLTILALGGIWLLMSRNQLRQRMKELELRNQIAADLHDEVGSSLSSIHMLSQMAIRPGNEDTHKNILERMSIHAGETMDRMGDIVWMIKPSDTAAGSLKQRMERFAYEICSSKNMEIQLQLEELNHVKFTMEEKKNIYLIFKEALNNAVKYSGSEKIEVTTSLQNKELTLRVKDFGKGFDMSVVKKGNGLDNIQHRAKELTGEIQITTTINVGTTVQLVVPL